MHRRTFLLGGAALGPASLFQPEAAAACMSDRREISGVLRLIDRRVSADPRQPLQFGVRQKGVQLEVQGIDVPAAGGSCIRARTLHLIAADRAAEQELFGKVGSSVTVAVEWLGERHPDLGREWQAGAAVARGVRLVRAAQ